MSKNAINIEQSEFYDYNLLFENILWRNGKVISKSQKKNLLKDHCWGIYLFNLGQKQIDRKSL